MAKTMIRTEEPGLAGSLPRLFLFSALGMLVTMLALLLLAVMISHGLMPESIRSATALSCIPGTFLSGFLTGKAAGRRILPMGLASGGLYFVLLLLISLIWPGMNTWQGLPWILAACLGGSAAGGLCAAGLRRR